MLHNMHALLLLLILTPGDSAKPRWTVPDKAAAVIGGVSYVVDYSTTRYMLDHGAYETNPLVGRHPSVTTLRVYTLVHLTAYVIAELKLPPPVRRAVTIGVLLLEGGYAAGGNLAREGFHFSF